MEQMVRELTERYGRISYIPDRVVRERGLIRIMDVTTMSQTLVDAVRHNALKEKFVRLLTTRAGYIPPHALDRIEGHQQDRRSLPDEYVQEVVRLADGMVDAGLPRLHERWTFGQSQPTVFSSLLCGKVVTEVLTRFPVVDFVVAFSIGTLERNRAAIAATVIQKTGRRQGKYPLLPCWPKHFLRFCEVAFCEDGTFSPHLREEIEQYAVEHFDYTSEDKRDNALIHLRKVLAFLEDRLGGIAAGRPRQYMAWDGNLDIFADRRWYLAFHPEEREGLAQTYFDAQSIVPVGPARAILNRMRDVFSGQAISDAELERREAQVKEELLRVKVQEAIATNSLKTVPAKAFFCGKFPELLRAAAEHIRARYKQVGEETPERAFVGTNQAYEFLDLPTPVATVPALKDTIDEERLRVAMQLPDAKFVELFVHGSCARHTFLGKSSSREDNYAGRALGRYLRERRRTLASK